MANHFVARFPGTTVQLTRSSENRVYAFVVASQGPAPEAILARHLGSATSWRRYANAYQAKIDAGSTDERYPEWVADYLARAEREEAFTLEQAQVEAALVTEWGWASRLDLAEKVAQKARNRGFQNVQILPAIRTAKRAR